MYGVRKLYRDDQRGFIRFGSVQNTGSCVRSFSLFTLTFHYTGWYAYIEKEDSKKLKQKQREKMQPKMGKMDIDYQVCFTDHLFMLLGSHMDYHYIIHVVNIQHGGTAELGY